MIANCPRCSQPLGEDAHVVIESNGWHVHKRCSLESETKRPVKEVMGIRMDPRLCPKCDGLMSGEVVYYDKSNPPVLPHICDCNKKMAHTIYLALGDLCKLVRQLEAKGL